ncbi:MAG: tetratricopeptide repeat protein, partial [Candidatus Promineofilum sp.]|nr:tetratricopeptide repeat protein [Promineifilum sp.]
MKLRLAADRVLRAITLKRQAHVAVLASAALSIVAAVDPGLLSADLIAIKNLLNVSAISVLLKKVADDDQTLSDEQIAAQMEALLPAGDALQRLATGQADLLRALTKQHSWQQQMLLLQESDAEAGARLLAGLAEMGVDLAAIRDTLAEVATVKDVARLEKLIREAVVPRLSEPVRAKYLITGDHRGSQWFIESTVNVPWSKPEAYTPPSPPAPSELPNPGSLPPGSYLPYERNERFTGREAQLLDLAALLLEGGAAGPVVVSAGIGGVGKSHLAVEFAYRYGRFFHGVHWVSAENPEAIDSAVATCGMRMGLHPAFGGLALAEQVALTERAWAGPEARLIILDNCEQEGLLGAWRPKGGRARVLVTSRRERWDSPAARVRLLGPMSRPEGVRLLQSHLTEGEGRPPRTDVAEDDLRAVAIELGELPLALRLAGAFLRRYRGLAAADYLAELRRAGPLAHRSLHGERGVAATFHVSFDRLRPDDPTDAAAIALLARAACFAPGEPLPEGLLRATAGQQPADESEAEPEQPPFEDGLERLLELGLLEPAGEGYRLHRLLAGFAADAITGEEMDAARAAVEEAVISLAYEQNAAGDPRRLRDWEIHLRHVTDLAFDREDNAAATLCTNLGFYLKMSGDLPAARPYLERSLAIRERVLGPEHPDTAASLNNLGYLLQAMGDLPAARPYYERALAIRERALGPEHPDTAQSLNNMGALLRAMGDLPAARPYYERALAIRERVLGPEHPDTALSLNNLGALLQAMGDLPAARPYYERALAIRERVLGPEHPDTATSLNNMGMMLQA